MLLPTPSRGLSEMLIETPIESKIRVGLERFSLLFFFIVVPVWLIFNVFEGIGNLPIYIILIILALLLLHVGTWTLYTESEQSLEEGE